MSNTPEIERAAARLPPAELAKLAASFSHRQAEEWDLEIRRDAQTGRLDGFIDEALEALTAGQTTEAP